MHYSDIYLIPAYSEIESRDNINTEVEFLGRKFKCPVLPANMATTISFEKAEELSEAGYFYILDRFDDYNKISYWISTHKLKTMSISIGVKENDSAFLYDLAEISKFNHFNVDFITIDVAHGHHKLVKEMINEVKIYLPKAKIIAGNVMTSQAVLDLKSWGADAVKVGLSQGAGCSTYNTTGIGGPMFSTILECSKFGIPIIADGGIKEKADYCKALVAGATMIMAGSKFAQLKDSPAEIYQRKEHPSDIELPKGYTFPTMKIYFGSASARNKGYNKYIEGKEQVLLPMKDQTYLEYLDEVEQAIRSCMSYGNCHSISEMKKIKYEILH